MRYQVLKHEFVESFPDRLEPGILYISVEFASVAHNCCCGCGEEVVTPLTPTDWNITYDGETVTLHPSVGSWTLRCRSHYVIRQGKVIEAPSWSNEKIATERQRDRAAKTEYFARKASPLGSDKGSNSKAATVESKSTRTKVWWKRIFHLF
jgi:Family of unknown function (DUF6527)